jgi:magnesium transporter
MSISCLELDDALHLAPCPPERAFAIAQEPGRRVWLDAQAGQPGDLAVWLDNLRVRGLARHLCLDGLDRPGFYPLREEVLLVIPLLAGEDGVGRGDHIGCLCRENLLLTVHLRPGRELQKGVFKRDSVFRQSETWLPECTIPGLVAALMMALSLECLRRSGDLRREVLALEERMDRTPDTVEAEEVIDKRSELLEVAAVVSDQLPAVRALGEVDTSVFRFGEARTYMRCAVTNLEAAHASLGWLDQRLGELRYALQMNAQDKLNQRLGMLTALSAIFMPVTLMAGIWGMNFAGMPELQWRFGYPLALGLMVVVGAAMYRFFRRSGWFH